MTTNADTLTPETLVSVDASAPADGMSVLSPHLVCRGASAAIDFYVVAFGATEMMRLASDDGRIMHAAVSINGASVMLVDEDLDYGLSSPTTLGGTPVTVHLLVDDADAWVARAVAAGATVTMPVDDMFWGDRYGVIQDPFGHAWAMSQPLRAMTPDEIAAASKLATM